MSTVSILSSVWCESWRERDAFMSRRPSSCAVRVSMAMCHGPETSRPRPRLGQRDDARARRPKNAAACRDLIMPDSTRSRTEFGQRHREGCSAADLCFAGPPTTSPPSINIQHNLDDCRQTSRLRNVVLARAQMVHQQPLSSSPQLASLSTLSRFTVPISTVNRVAPCTLSAKPDASADRVEHLARVVLDIRTFEESDNVIERSMDGNIQAINDNDWRLNFDRHANCAAFSPSNL